MTEYKKQNFYTPRYWPAWLLIGLMWALTQLLPYKTLLSLGKFIGIIMMKLDKRQRHIATVNINLCFPELSKKEKQKLLRESFISVGIAIFEGCLAWWASDKKLRPLAHIHGLENIDIAKQYNKGVFVLGVHFTTLELVGRLFSMTADIAIVYRSNKKPFLNFLMEKIRIKHYLHAIERNNLRGIIKTLKRNETVWYTPDIDGGRYDHVFAPFFDISAASLTAPSRLAKLTGAKTVLSTYYRRKDGTGYDLHVSPPLDDFPTDSIENDITRINQLIETAIREKPEQYIWQYMRFKTRPTGEKRFYRGTHR